jgi:uncharacterized membrane protein
MYSSWLRVACPALFLVLALATALSLAWNVPPFLSADEGAHLHRANLITHGRLFGERVQVSGRTLGGGPTDRALFDAAEPFNDEIGQPDNTTDALDFTLAGAARWDDREVRTSFGGSAAYPPFFYLPASAGLWLGKALHLPVLQSVYLARAFNALACALVGCVALVLAGRAQLALFALLLLPMASSLYGATTQDGMVLVTAALAAACVSRALAAGVPMRNAEIAVAATCIALIGMTKPPYLLLMLVLLAAPAENRKGRGAIVFVATALACLWHVWSGTTVQTPLVRPDAVLSPAGQVGHLISNPAAAFELAFRTLAEQGRGYWSGFIGILGWLDTPLPAAYYTAAGIMLALAFAGSLSLGRDRDWRLLTPGVLLALVLAAGGVFLALYVIWTPVAAPVVEGVQGRYFLPLAVFLPLLVEGERPLLPRGWGTAVESALAALVLVFPLITLLVVERAVILRFYLD